MKVVEGIFKLSLCGSQGFLNLVLTLMNILLNFPTYTCISNAFEDRKN
ncbi:Mobile element protein (plasmid) [Candidatus Enterovibrio escicola]|uniref:Mobile element protein n=1 Tax=Candidatus Enterovibrio escicola TaxID=1927127 RepID=A0A2A5T1Q5_9GAMM|nr:Mobile element protein [Candidatus Enterovibrio escacola]